MGSSTLCLNRYVVLIANKNMLLSSRAVKSMNLVDEEPDNSVITNNFALLLPILSFKDDLKTTSEIGV